SQPARPITLDPETGLYQIPRAQTAETRYEFYVSQEKTPKLRHRMTIQIKPGQGELGALSSARHELGHALGIWGHSSDQNDALYFSQTGQTPHISERDIQTLRRIYGESTRLGWPLP
ncbi:MAG: matrixin family metalloprotease, partial [Cyanobacteria bacterium P01_H01_bin.15]